MKRPAQLATSMPEQVDLDALAERCRYEGSAEHKDQRSWLGLPNARRNPRDTATICPLVRDEHRELATGWVRAAIRSRQFGTSVWEGGFPRYVWYRNVDGQIWFGRLMNRGAGARSVALYKGWPITEDEWRENFA